MSLGRATLIVGAVAGFLIGPGPPQDVVTQPAATAKGDLSITRIGIDVGTDGVERVVFSLAGEVPDDRITYVQDINDVEAPGIAYTTQEYTPEDQSPLWTCGDKHFGFSPPATVGQVDVLFPAAWFGDSPPIYEDIPVEDNLEEPTYKTVLCEPRDGFVQFAIWSPASHDPDDVEVRLEGNRLIVETARKGC